MGRTVSSSTGLRGGLAALAGVAVLVGCATERSLDPERLDALIDSAIADGVGVAPTAVSCPPVTDIVDGTTFVCEATLDGQTLRMAGVVVDASEGEVEVENVDAVLFVGLLEQVIADDVSRQLGETITIECGTGELIIAEVGSELSCTASDSVGNEADVLVEVVDAEGNVTFELG